MPTKKLGDLIDELHELREERRDLEKSAKEVEQRYKAMEAEVLESLQRAGLDKASGDLASVSISETEVPSVKDWTKLTRFIKRNDAMHLFERRLSKSAWVELMQERKGRPLPGVETYERVSLNMRAR